MDGEKNKDDCNAAFFAFLTKIGHPCWIGHALKMTRETPEVRSDKRKLIEDTQNRRYHRYRRYNRKNYSYWPKL